MTEENDKALIIFSRLPIGHETKTRLAPILNEAQRAELHLAMWHDIFAEVLKLTDTDVYLYWTGSGDVQEYQQYIPYSFRLVKQEGDNLGERMSNAMRKIFAAGYKRAVIIGSDVPSVKVENLAAAFDSLNDSEAAIGPSKDGGYWLIGMRKYIPEVFRISSWGGMSVLDETICVLKKHSITYKTADILQDLDTPEDVYDFMSCKNLDENVKVKSALYLMEHGFNDRLNNQNLQL